MSKTKTMTQKREGRAICLLVNDEKVNDERLMGTCKIQMFSKKNYFSLHQLIVLHHFGTGLHFCRLESSRHSNFFCIFLTSYLIWHIDWYFVQEISASLNSRWTYKLHLSQDSLYNDDVFFHDTAEMKQHKAISILLSLPHPKSVKKNEPLRYVK